MGVPQYDQALAARVATDHMDGRVVVQGEGAPATRDDVKTYAVRTVTAVEYELYVHRCAARQSLLGKYIKYRRPRPPWTSHHCWRRAPVAVACASECEPACLPRYRRPPARSRLRLLNVCAAADLARFACFLFFLPFSFFYSHPASTSGRIVFRTRRTPRYRIIATERRARSINIVRLI